MNKITRNLVEVVRGLDKEDQQRLNKVKSLIQSLFGNSIRLVRASDEGVDFDGWVGGVVKVEGTIDFAAPHATENDN